MRKSFQEDWTLLAFLVTTSVGFIVAILDFVFLQNLKFQVTALAGLLLLLVGGYVRSRARLELKNKAGFSSLAATGRLKVIGNHRLVTDGLYKHIRHPIYLGETIRNVGLVLIFSSIYGLLLIAAATTLLLFRIRTEEKVLTKAFGDEYKEYQRKNQENNTPHLLTDTTQRNQHQIHKLTNQANQSMSKKKALGVSHLLLSHNFSPNHAST